MPAEKETLSNRLWRQALEKAATGDRKQLCMFLRLSGDIPVPLQVRKVLADVIEGNVKWKTRASTRAQREQHEIREIYQSILKAGHTAKVARQYLSKECNISEETIRDIVERRKTFRGT